MLNGTMRLLLLLLLLLLPHTLCSTVCPQMLPSVGLIGSSSSSTASSVCHKINFFSRVSLIPFLHIHSGYASCVKLTCPAGCIAPTR
jgi:hypothetical protein